jgi:drug/metabolite transporter (DMT)-like permease
MRWLLVLDLYQMLTAGLRGSLLVPPRTTADPATIGAVTVAVLAVSTSGPMIAYAAAPALAIAFWRNAMAVGALAPVALVQRRAELAALTRGNGRRAGLFCVLAGVALSAHFAAWVPSTKLTSIATAAALVATQPVWQGLIAVVQGRRLPRLTWLGIAVAVLGAAVATGADVTASGAAVFGDVLALLGALAAAVYVALGEQARTTTSTTSYTAVCYTVCAVLLLVVCLVWRLPLGGYPATAWLALVGITVGPQLLGHSLFNFALRRMAATTMSVLGLLEVPGAALIGWLWLGQVPRRLAWPGLALLLLGVGIVVLARRRERETEPVPLAEPEADVITL